MAFFGRKWLRFVLWALSAFLLLGVLDWLLLYKQRQKPEGSIGVEVYYSIDFIGLGLKVPIPGMKLTDGGVDACKSTGSRMNCDSIEAINLPARTGLRGNAFLWFLPGPTPEDSEAVERGVKLGRLVVSPGRFNLFGGTFLGYHDTPRLRNNGIWRMNYTFIPQSVFLSTVSESE